MLHRAPPTRLLTQPRDPSSKVGVRVRAHARGVGRVDLDPLLVDVHLAGSQVLCNRHGDAAAVAQRRHRLHHALAEGPLAHDGRALVVLEGARHDLARARGVAVDEEEQGGLCVGPVLLRREAVAGPSLVDHRHLLLPRLQEDARGVHPRPEEAPRVVAEVHHAARDPPRGLFVHLCLHQLRRLGVKLLDLDPPRLAAHPPRHGLDVDLLPRHRQLLVRPALAHDHRHLGPRGAPHQSGNLLCRHLPWLRFDLAHLLEQRVPLQPRLLRRPPLRHVYDLDQLRLLVDGERDPDAAHLLPVASLGDRLLERLVLLRVDEPRVLVPEGLEHLLADRLVRLLGRSVLALDEVLPDLEPVLVVEGPVHVDGVYDGPSIGDRLLLRAELRRSDHGGPDRDGQPEGSGEDRTPGALRPRAAGRSSEGGEGGGAGFAERGLAAGALLCQGR
mmetsp:Transcript_10512/g.25999  ORF Transcript_10512/g.25999 Transcript_10512/m.25999 type:complete len:444 (+) Transcript_10512:3-1334(+)